MALFLTDDHSRVTVSLEVGFYLVDIIETPVGEYRMVYRTTVWIQFPVAQLETCLFRLTQTLIEHANSVENTFVLAIAFSIAQRNIRSLVAECVQKLLF